MGIHSTLEIKRRHAEELMMRRINNLSDRELEEVLFILYGNKTYFNFQIVDSYDGGSGRIYPDHQEKFSPDWNPHLSE